MVSFGALPLRSTDVVRLVDASREVLRGHGSTTYGRTIHLATDDITVAADCASQVLGQPARKFAADVHVNALTYGMCWGSPKHGYVIWLSPTLASSPSRSIQSTVHEVAHALTRTAHGFTWRRAFVVLHGLWRLSYDLPRFSGDDARQVVDRYAVRTPRINRDEEITSHTLSASRAMRRHGAVFARVRAEIGGSRG